MKTILASVDFSTASKQVVAEASKLAQAVKARLVLLHVVQPPVVTDNDFRPQLGAEYVAAAAATATKHLTALQKPILAKGVAVETKHLVGHPGQCIVEHARKLRADYIVLGSHGHGAFYDLIVGSTTSRVLRKARCTVVVVPQLKPRK
ncbi:MAG: universal stress protein [Candidatus Didemnitutus sp.]|nr:universal stress protein [Candidatus Didemnitutus sp.]